MALVRYLMLGPMTALVDGRPADLGGPRQRGVLVVLLSDAGRLVPASHIVDAIWGDEPPASAANLVQRSISQLRKSLGKDAIETRGAGYMARIEPDALDLHVFERLLRAGSTDLREGRYEEAGATLRQALDLWRGAALADLADQDFLVQEAARLDELRLLAAERAVEADLGLGRHADATAEIEALVHSHPLRERPRELLMRALYGAGRQAEALDAYRAARSTFVDELGIEPGPALRDLEQAVLRQDPSLRPAENSAERPVASEAPRVLMVAQLGPGGAKRLAPLAAILARRPPREIVLAQTVADRHELTAASERLHAIRETLGEDGLDARAAAFTSVTPGADLARLAAEQDADLLLLDAPERLLEDGPLLTLLERAPCDVGVLIGAGPVDGARAGAVLGRRPRLVGGRDRRLDRAQQRSAAAPRRCQHEPPRARCQSASRQCVAGRAARPRGCRRSRCWSTRSRTRCSPRPTTPASWLSALQSVGGARALALSRTRLATAGDLPVLLVRRGVRPGGLAPGESDTRFTWTLAGA